MTAGSLVSWFVLGLGWSFGLLTIAYYGVYVLLISVVVTVPMIFAPAIREGWPAFIAGPAPALICLGYVIRNDSGDVNLLVLKIAGALVGLSIGTIWYLRRDERTRESRTPPSNGPSQMVRA